MQKTEFRARLDRCIDGMYRVVGLLLDNIERQHAPMPKGPLAPAAALAWRWANDQFGFWRLCAKPTCRRARYCRGEPRACLERHLPSVPQDMCDRVRRMLRAARTSTAAVSPK
jgi:hypothetical protein